MDLPENYYEKNKDREVSVQVKDIHKTFKVGVQDVEILKGVSFEIHKGEFAIVFGPSGCGKSTLLHTILGLEPPSGGEVRFLNEDLYAGRTEDMRSDFRKRHIGMVYQQANWIRALNVKENVAFPLTLLGISKTEAIGKAIDALRIVEMDGWAEYVPTELSSGQQQRVSMARALINDPSVIVADEPTGNLDFQSGQYVMELLHKLTVEKMKTVIMVTHDLEYLKYSNKIVRMLDGSVVGIYDDTNKDQVLASIAFKRGNDSAGA